MGNTISRKDKKVRKLVRQTASRRSSPKSRGPLVFVAVLVGGLVLTGLAIAIRWSGQGNGTDFPAYVYNSAMTLKGYQAAVKVGDGMKVIPCYCGCVYEGHQDLRDCFFKPDGSYNGHASNCHLCVEEAASVGDWYDQGLTWKEIRARIEQQYGSHGPGTNTPPVG